MNQVVGLKLGFVLAFLCSYFSFFFFFFKHLNYLHMVNHALMSSNIHFINLLRFELILTFRQVGLKLVIDFSIGSRHCHLKLSLFDSWLNCNFIYFNQGHLLNPLLQNPRTYVGSELCQTKSQTWPNTSMLNPIHYRDYLTMIPGLGANQRSPSTWRFT
jgi:hypothetical protein